MNFRKASSESRRSRPARRILTFRPRQVAEIQRSSLLAWLTPTRSNQFVRRDREVAHAFARGVKDRVGDRRRDSGDPDLAEPATTERVEMRIGLVNEEHFDFRHVGVYRH